MALSRLDPAGYYSVGIMATHDSIIENWGELFSGQGESLSKSFYLRNYHKLRTTGLIVFRFLE